MKVPKHIRHKMHRLAELSRKVKELSSEIEEWFVTNGFDPEFIRCGDGDSFEELEYGNDVTENFCDRIENGCFCRKTEECP